MRRPPTSVVVAVAALALVLAGAHFHREAEAPFRPGQPAPPLRLVDLDGRPVDLAALRGKVVVLNFWATWCEPCRTELPSLDRLHRALANDGLAVVAVSVDDRATDVSGFLRARSLTLPVWRDPGGGEAARGWDVTSYPVTFVVDAAGRLQARYLGVAEWDLPEALDHFRGLIKESTSPTR